MANGFQHGGMSPPGGFPPQPQVMQPDAILNLLLGVRSQYANKEFHQTTTGDKIVEHIDKQVLDIVSSFTIQKAPTQ